MNAPIITLKNVKYMASHSQETHCFTATVYVDGKKFCTAQNDGHGGCDSYDVSYDSIHEVARLINPNACLRHGDVNKDENQSWPYPDNWFKTFSMTSASVFEAVVSELMNTWLTEKDIKNDLRNSFVCIKAKSDDAGIFVYRKKQFGDMDIEQVKCGIERHMAHEVEIINGWPMADIKAAYELDAAA